MDIEKCLAERGTPQDLVITWGYVPPLTPSTPEEKGAILAALQNEELSSQDIAILLGPEGQPQNNNIFTLTNDPEFINGAVTALLSANNPSTAKALLDELPYASLSQETFNNIDFTQWDTTGSQIWFPTHHAEDFLTIEQLNKANIVAWVDLSGRQDLSDLDLKNFYPQATANFSGSNITGAQVSNMSKALENYAFAPCIQGNFQNTNLTGLNTEGAYIVSADLSKTTGITGTNIRNSGSLSNVNLTGIDMTGFDTIGTYTLYDTNFSTTTNLTGSALNGCSYVSNCNFSGTNLSGLDLSQKYYTGCNFQNATGLTAENLASAEDIRNANLKGTGISKAALSAALITAGKDPNSWSIRINDIQFDN